MKTKSKIVKKMSAKVLSALIVLNTSIICDKSQLLKSSAHSLSIFNSRKYDISKIPSFEEFFNISKSDSCKDLNEFKKLCDESDGFNPNNLKTLDNKAKKILEILHQYLKHVREIQNMSDYKYDVTELEFFTSAVFKKKFNCHYMIKTNNSSQMVFFGEEMNVPSTSNDMPVDELISLIVLSETKKAGKISNEIFMNKLKPFAVPGAIAGILMMSTGSAKNIYNGILETGRYIYGLGRVAYNRFIYNRLTLETDPVKLRKMMNVELQRSVFCQRSAIRKIVEIMCGMADLWAVSDKTGVPCTSACTMTFIGDSGVGKTLAARTLSKLFFNRDMQPWQFITSTSVTASSNSSNKNNSNNNSNQKQDQSKTEEKLSPADQLFNANSELIRQLKLNNRVIIVLDEIDKMHKADPDDTVLERLRDARDTGKLLIRKGVNYEFIDVSRTVFICISNERRECWGLPEVNLTPVQAASRTSVSRDRSLTNRFDVVEFDYFNREAYTIIMRPLLEKLQQEYLKYYNIVLAIDDKLVNSIANESVKLNKGARGVNDYLTLLRGALVKYRSKNNISGKLSSPSYLVAEYNSEKKSFNIDTVDESDFPDNYYEE